MPWPTTFFYIVSNADVSEWKHDNISFYQCHPRRLSQLKIRKFIAFEVLACGACLFMTWRFNILKFLIICGWFLLRQSKVTGLKSISQSKKGHRLGCWNTLSFTRVVSEDPVWLVYRVCPCNFCKGVQKSKVNKTKHNLFPADLLFPNTLYNFISKSVVLDN
jgi:hypothetical protein